MKALLGNRKWTIPLALAITLAITASPARDRTIANRTQNTRICFVIDGQIYCIP